MTQTIERTVAFEGARPAASPRTAASAQTAVSPRRKPRRKPSCQTCFFGNRGLCALELDEPCSTYRPDDTHGLSPPTQPALLARDSELAA